MIVLRISFILIFLSLMSCEENNPELEKIKRYDSFISAVDISYYPEIEDTDLVFSDQKGNEGNLPDILSETGINTIRLRLWVNPEDEHSGFEEVLHFSQSLKEKGFKLWLNLHYSDTWADPGKQETPVNWTGLSFLELKMRVIEYTGMVVRELEPDWIQIGNEINSGFLHPHGNIHTNEHQFLDLLSSAINAVKQTSPETSVILHFAGIEGAVDFFARMDTLTYDIIGLSYYPFWHGKNIQKLRQSLINLGSLYNREVVIAETAYPFTLEWNDLTHNIVGSEDHLILPSYPATPDGQKQFVSKLISILLETPKGAGICYWGGELVSWKGYESTTGSHWENQAIFDFNNRALPVLNAF